MPRLARHSNTLSEAGNPTGVSKSTGTMHRRLTSSLVAVLFSMALPANADTLCTMAGPTPGFKAIKLELPQGSSYIGLELGGARTTTLVNDGSSWHFSRGIFLLDSQMRILSYRVQNSGSVPRRTVVEAGGERQQVNAGLTDGPFIHSAQKLIPSLSPGTYYAVAFGSDGSSRVPNEFWSADVRVQGAQSCAQVGVGSVFDINHTDFTGGTQVYSAGIGVAEGIEGSLPSSRQLVLGMMDASVQITGEARLDYSLSSGETGSLDDEIVPFVTGPGTSSFSASFMGPFPIISISGVAIDLTA